MFSELILQEDRERRKSPEGKSVSSPISPTSPPLRSTITIAKGVVGLGLQIEGGPAQPRGPYIVVAGFTAGSEAAKVRELELIFPCFRVRLVCRDVYT